MGARAEVALSRVRGLKPSAAGGPIHPAPVALSRVRGLKHLHSSHLWVMVRRTLTSAWIETFPAAFFG